LLPGCPKSQAERGAKEEAREAAGRRKTGRKTSSAKEKVLVHCPIKSVLLHNFIPLNMLN